jgi:glycosyltransferase involved in cell wall biosynthesis
MYVCYYLADQNPHRDRTLGITGYTNGLLKVLADRSEVTPCAFASRSSYRPVGLPIDVKCLPFPTDKMIMRLIGDQMHPLFCCSKADIWHYPKGYLPAFLKPRQPVVGTVHDVIIQYYADRYPESRNHVSHLYWLFMLKRSIPRFDLILTVSEYSKNAIQNFCERHRLFCPPIKVTYQGCQFEDVPQQTSIPKEDYVIHFASRWAHKQTSALLRLWASSNAETKQWPSLRLIGKINPESCALLDELPNVVFLAHVSADELQQQIQRARALIFPSEIEGFGLPVLEAYYLTTPVVYVRGTVAEELLGGEAPGGFNLDDAKSFNSAMEKVLRLSTDDVAAVGVRLRKTFSWEACVSKTLSAYRSVT